MREPSYVAQFSERFRAAGWSVREISTGWTGGKLWTLHCAREHDSFFVEGDVRREVWKEAWAKAQKNDVS